MNTNRVFCEQKGIPTAQAYTAGLALANTTIPAVNSNVACVCVQITEPPLMSPFIFGSLDRKAVFSGFTSMSFQMNMAANASRAWRSIRLKTANGAATLLKKAPMSKNAPLLS